MLFPNCGLFLGSTSARSDSAVVRRLTTGTVANSALFPFLAQNLRSLIGFLEDIREHNLAFARRLLNADVNPGEFFDTWAAWGSNLTPETFRQAVTNL